MKGEHELISKLYNIYKIVHNAYNTGSQGSPVGRDLRGFRFNLYTLAQDFPSADLEIPMMGMAKAARQLLCPPS